MGDEKLYTTQQAAVLLGVCDSYIRRMIGAGKAHPKTRIGNSYVFDMAEIERLRSRPKGKSGPKPK